MADAKATFEDGTSVVYRDVPEGLTPEQFIARVQKNVPGKSLAAVERGEFDALETQQHGLVTLAKGIREAALDVLRSGLAGGWDAVLGMGELAKQGVRATVPGAIGSRLVDLGSKALTGKNLDELHEQGKQQLPGATYPPQTKAGEYAKSIGAATVGAMIPGGPLSYPQRGAVGAVSGVGSQLAADLVHDDPLTRLLGGLAGGLVAGYPLTRDAARNANELLADAVHGRRPQDFAAAQATTADAKTQGIPLLASEAFEAPTGLPALTRQVMQHPRVAPTIYNALEGRPDAVNTALATQPGGVLVALQRSKQATATDLQDAMAKALEQVHGRAREAYAKALPTDPGHYSGQQVKKLYDDLTDIAEKFAPKDPRHLKVKELANTLQDELGMWVTDKRKVNELYKLLGDSMRNADPTLRLIPQFEAKKVFRAATPEFQPARNAFRQIMEGEYNPLARSVVGKIAQAGGGPQADRLTASKALVSALGEMSPAEIRLIGHTARQSGNPTAFNTAVRQHFVSKLEQLRETSRGFPDLELGGKLAGQFRTASGALDPQTTEMLRQIAINNKIAPNELVAGYARFFQTLNATRHVGFPARPELSGLETQQAASKNLPSLMVAAMSRTARYWENVVRGKQYKEIADVLTSPEGVQQLRVLAKQPPTSRGAQLVVSNLLAAALPNVQEVEREHATTP